MKIATILFIIGLMMFPVIGLTQTSEAPVSPTQPTAIVSPAPATVNPNTTYFCGDGKCDSSMGETTANCEKDCPLPTLRWDTCGDKICQSTETKSSCSVDCGYPWVCGDGICGGTETDWNCSQDCPKAEATIVSAPQTTDGSLVTIKCGVNSFGINNECGVGMYANTYIQCYDGYEPIKWDAGSCKSSETWSQYAKELCVNHCSTGYTPKPLPTQTTPITPTPTTFGGTTGGGFGSAYTAPAPTPATSPIPVLTAPVTKCGFSTTKFCNECGAGVYKNVFVKCNDGSEITLGSASSCKPIDLWNQYANEACVSHCSSGGWGGWSDITSGPVVCAESSSGGGNISTPLPPVTTKPVETPKATPVCYIGDYLFQKYNQLIIELQKSESDKTRTELITKEIIALKQQIATQQKECVSNSTQSKPTTVSSPAPAIAPQSMTTSAPIAIENKPVAVSIDRCNEVAQWETKIVYYKKLGNLSDDELKKNGFSREEIEKILQELSLGIEKVRTQCTSQEKTSAIPKATAITGSASITETVRPVVIESGQEIGTYYKARLEKAVSSKGEEKQIEELKTLRDEIDGLISNLIKSRKELEISELNTLVKEVKVSRGEIKADNISVKTTEKKMILSVGDRPVSVEPTENHVLIRDKGLEVNTDEVTIKENVLSVGGVDVKMSASEVTEKLGLTPTTIELKEENAKAVYNMKIDERRKLFWFIPLNIRRTVSADAENGNTLSDQRPWYNFLTTK